MTTCRFAAQLLVSGLDDWLHRADIAFTIDTYEHMLPGMQADAARIFEQLVAPGLLPAEEKSEKSRQKRRRKTA